MKVAIAGAGKLGIGLTKVLSDGGHNITLIDSNDAAIQKAQSEFDVRTVFGDARKADVLKDLGIDSYDLFIAATDEDEKNIFIGSLAKKIGCRAVVVRMRSPEHVDQIGLICETFGADYIVNPDLACAEEIYKFLTEKNGISGGRFAVGGAEVLSFPIEHIPGLADSYIREISALPEGALIAAVSRGGKVIVPNGNTKLLPEDRLYVICPKTGVGKLRHQLRGAVSTGKNRRVMIAGGGKTGYYLARMLTKSGVSVKIIETNRTRCEYLASSLEHTLVVHGSASDSKFLADENLSAMDAFVAVTDTDETNILLSMLAKQANVKNIVAKVSHNDFRQLADRFDDIMTVNPVEMCVADILHWFGKGEYILFTQLIQGQAEIMEVLAEESMSLTGRPLSELQIPEGVLIATVTRNGSVIIPSGTTVIQAGDRVVIFSMLTSAGPLESLLSKGNPHTL
ncbi:MAG: Trk system potassium transporter TrkA [Eubacteriales bacterium]|nr:Trk system potassium transporter TrkA [Eubacteriales bacterium]